MFTAHILNNLPNPNPSLALTIKVQQISKGFLVSLDTFKGFCILVLISHKDPFLDLFSLIVPPPNTSIPAIAITAPVCQLLFPMRPSLE